MFQYLAWGSLQAGGVVAGGGQGADTQLQPADHFVAAAQLGAQILDQMLQRRRLVLHFKSTRVTAASEPAAVRALIVLLIGQRRAHLQVIKL